MLAGDRAAPCEDLREQLVEGAVSLLANRGIFHVSDHDIHVNVPVAGVAEACDRETMALLQAGGEFHQIDKAPARDDDVLVEFFEAGGFERLRIKPPQPPKRLAGRGRGGLADAEGARLFQNPRQRRSLRPDARRLAINLDQNLSAAGRELGLGVECTGGLEREFIGNFQSGRQEPTCKNRTDGFRGCFDCGKSRREHGSGGRMREQTQRGLRHHAQQALGPREEADQIEAGFVFVGAPAATDNFPVRQNHSEPEHIIPRDAVFQAARTAGIRGDVPADAAVLQARGVGGIEQPLAPRGILQLPCDNTRLDHRHEVGSVYFEDALHAVEAKDDPASDRGAAAHIAIASAARRDRDACAVGFAQGESRFFRGAGENHQFRRAAGEPFVGGEFRRRVFQHAGRAEFFPELADERCVHAGSNSWKKCHDSATPSAAGSEAVCPPAARTVSTTSGMALDGQQGEPA